MKKSVPVSSTLSPVPNLMITVGDMTDSNIITIAWAGVINSSPFRVYISVQPPRHSYEILNNTKEFVINLVPKDMIRASAWCGSHSGRDYDKFAQTGLTKQKADKVACPLIAECPVNLECKVFETKDLGTHRMFMADVVATHVEKKYLKGDRIMFDEMDLSCYLTNGRAGAIVPYVKD